MSDRLYQNTTLGTTLIDTLDELILSGQMSADLALKIVEKFGKATNRALTNDAKKKITFKGEMKAHRFCDNVWTMVVQNAEFKENSTAVTNVDKVKIVAYDPKAWNEHGTVSQPQAMPCSFHAFGS